MTPIFGYGLVASAILVGFFCLFCLCVWGFFALLKWLSKGK